MIKTIGPIVIKFKCPTSINKSFRTIWLNKEMYGPLAGRYTTAIRNICHVFHDCDSKNDEFISDSEFQIPFFNYENRYNLRFKILLDPVNDNDIWELDGFNYRDYSSNSFIDAPIEISEMIEKEINVAD